MPNLPAVSRFNKTVQAISRLYINARKSQVHFAFETGRLIFKMQQSGLIKTQYGSHFIVKLSEALASKFGQGFSEENLRRMLRFYLQQKKSPATELPWSNLVELSRVKDAKMRNQIARYAAKEQLTKYELRRLVSKSQPTPRTPVKRSDRELPPLKPPTDLRLNTYAKYNADEIDCGFYISYPATPAELKGVTVTDKPSYTYAACVERVIDGDTLCVGIQVGFGLTLHDKLRLRGIDTPELSTAKGRAAKLYVQKLLPVGATVVLKSRKIIVDTHGRFVMDVFYLAPGTSAACTPQAIIAGGNYLNQHLIDAGHAVRMRE